MFNDASWGCELIAGLSQQQQSAAAPQLLSNRLRLMHSELAKGVGLRGEVLDRVYTKSGCVVSLDGSKVLSFVRLNWRDIILFLLPSHLLSLLQETFRKNALGLLSVAETCGEVGIKAVTAFERTVGPGNLKLSFFRGFETLYPPDMEEIIIT